MGVDWQAFATAFLNGTALNIKERKDDADEYEDELIQKAEDNKPLRKVRLGARDAGFQHILLARQLGADSRTIKAALRSGPKGLANLTAQLNAAKTSFLSKVGPDVQWTPEDVQATVMLGEDWQPESDDDSDEYMKGLLNKVYGVTGGGLPNSYKAKSSGNWLSERMGFGAKDRIRERLDQDTKYDGLSTYDMSKLDQTKDYDAGEFATAISYVTPEIFGQRSVSGERVEIDRVIRLRVEPLLDSIDLRIKEKQKDSYARTLALVETDKLENNARGMKGQTVDLKSIDSRVKKEIAALEAEKVAVKRKVLYDYFSNQMSLFPNKPKIDQITGEQVKTPEGVPVYRKIGYLVNMKGDIEDQLGAVLYKKLRLSLKLPISAELQTAAKVETVQKTSIADGTYDGGAGGEADNKKVLDIFKEIEKNAFNGETWQDYKGHVEATNNIATKIAEVINKKVLKGTDNVTERGVNQDELGNIMVMDTSGNTITIVDKDDTLTSFTFEAAKDENGDVVLDVDGKAAAIPVKMKGIKINSDGSEVNVTINEEEKVIQVWNDIGSINGLGEWVNPNNYLPFSSERLAELEKAGMLDSETDTAFSLGKNINPPSIYDPTVQSVTEEPIVLAAGKLREVTRGAAELDNEELINIIEFWKGTQQQLKDPAERKEQLREYLIDNHSDSNNRLTIKPEDVIPLWTEDYVEGSAPVIVDDSSDSVVEENFAPTSPSYEEDVLNTEFVGLGAKPVSADDATPEVTSAASTNPFVVEYIDDLVTLAKTRNNVSSKKSLENIEKGRLGQWNTLIATWARRNDIELPEKIADRKALLKELADEYIRIMKSE